MKLRHLLLATTTVIVIATPTLALESRNSNIDDSSSEHYIQEDTHPKKVKADALKEQGNQQLGANQYQAAYEAYNQALVIYRDIGDREGEADILNNLGSVFFRWGNYLEAMEYFQQSLAIACEIDDRYGEADTLSNLGIVSYRLGNYSQSIAYLEESLAIFRELSNRHKEANSLRYLGVVSTTLGNYSEATAYLEQSLSINRDLDDHLGKADTLSNLGVVSYRMGNYSDATGYSEQSLAIYRDIGDQWGEASALNNLGEISREQGNYPRAISYYEQSIAIYRDLGNRQGEAGALNNLGIVYKSLGNYSEAIEYYEQSLTILRDLSNRQGEARSLGNLGSVYHYLGKQQEAIEYYSQSLAIERDIGDRRGEAESLGSLGVAYGALGEYQEALEYFQQWLTVMQEIGDKPGEGLALFNIGGVFSDQHQPMLAIDYYSQSLAIQRDIGNREQEGATLHQLGDVFAQQDQPELAIIFYKQSVNVREAIRQDNRSLDTDLQQSYTDTIAGSYRELADLLLQQDRILEAQRVLDLLKVQELDDYFNNVRGTADSQQGIEPRTPETVINDGYNAIIDDAIALGRELTQLASIDPSDRTEAQRQRIIELRKAQEFIADNFRTFLDSSEVQAQLDKLRRDTEGETFDLAAYARNLQGDLQQLDNAVILYPLILDDRLELILISADSPPLRRTVPISRADLNAAILKHRQALTDERLRNSDAAQIAAQTLYNYLIKPLADDLTALDTETIIYAPDGQLRYVPLAALHDGTQWLIETYNINNITAVSLTNFTDQPSNQLSVLAGAFTDGETTVSLGQRSFNFDPLPAARREVELLASTLPTVQTRLESAFNPDIQYEANDYAIVHLATHAKFVSGTPEASFILFNNQAKETIQDVETWNLNNVDLVVLSACETAVGDELGNGQEILGLGYQMQRAGAKSTLASLWTVSDGGTQILMNQFYDILVNNPGITKAEALRQAQVAMIQNSVETELEQSTPSTGYTHPYYWSSFILIGNGL